MAGRPKPTALKILRGNPGKRALPKGEPKPASGKRAPSPPPYLNDVAAAEWRRLARVLHRNGLLTEVDDGTLAGLCENFALWRKASDELEEDGRLVLTTEKGNAIQNPLVGVRNRAWELYQKSLIEFGMTPAARARVTVAEQNTQDDDPFLRLRRTP
jgi:P27 family predicted phage terminase small subunit